MGKIKAIILAAGEGTRMKSQKTKALHEILKKPIVNYVTDAAKNAGADEIIIVAGDNIEALKANVNDVSFAHQTVRQGTGHAVMCAKEFIQDDDTIIILYVDGPLLQADTIRKIVAQHNRIQADATVVSCLVEDPAGYGRIIRENGSFGKIIEQKDANDEQRRINEINTGVYCFNGEQLLYALSRLTNNNAQNEYYLTDTLEILLNSGANVQVYLDDNPLDYYGVNDRLQLSFVTKIMQKRINEFHMRNGVTILDPDTAYIADGVIIGQDTVIGTNTTLNPGTVIGGGCSIGPDTEISASVIGNNCQIKKSVLDSCTVENNVIVGPFAYLRPKTVLRDNSKIGDFVEVKNSVIGKGSKANHLSYIGDTDIGEGVNFGCGAVTVNYNGLGKFRTTIEDGAFIGSNANLIAPVTVKKKGYVTAGSTITHEVPENALSFGRARQVNKEGKGKL